MSCVCRIIENLLYWDLMSFAFFVFVFWFLVFVLFCFAICFIEVYMICNMTLASGVQW